ncbi:beta-ketoacyl synthase N-terminal-like domain-containing protein [Amycolatopsis aidingensis]|uniref:beta-ketoacyl synthase N-terminal-like domain-containing protein n=1 Tax=Amycolatopsis aidingensis TaxID=2842453 RepID=UPI001C0C0C2B|nr:beta-ketoacyl synthase N-terminal-like domain-containing protein [Amycolatopsis aidingensis]
MTEELLAEPETSGKQLAGKELAITGFGVLSGLGIGPDALVDALTRPPEPVDVSGMFTEPLPRPDAHVLVDFHAAEHLGRKGTSFLDRGTAFGLLACRDALADAGMAEPDRARTGVVLGTTAGSLKSTSDYSRDTLTEERPYHVNPVLFPNAVMNGIAGQAAIRFGLRGLNATIAGGPLALLQALRYTGVALATGRAEVMLAGAVEEFSPQAAWSVQHAQRRAGGTLPAGEGAAVFLVEDAAAVRARGGRPDACVLSVTCSGSAASPGPAGTTDRLRECLRAALDQAGASAAQVRTVALGTDGTPWLDDAEETAVRQVLGAGAARLGTTQVTGVAGSASGAFPLAALLARHRAEPARDGELSVLSTRSADGSVAAAVVRGWSRAGGDHG